MTQLTQQRLVYFDTSFTIVDIFDLAILELFLVPSQYFLEIVALAELIHRDSRGTLENVGCWLCVLKQ